MDKNGIILITLFFCTILCAQNPPTLSFDEAIELGLKSNEDLLIQENNLKNSLFKVKETYSRFLPSVNAIGQYQVRKGSQFIEQQSEFVNNAKTNNLFGAIDASLNLFNGFNTINSIKESKNNKIAQENLLLRTKQDIVFQISTQYLKCLINKELHEIATNNLKTQQTLLEKISEEVDLGIRAEIDLLLQKSEVEKFNLEVLKANSVLQADKLRLANLIGIESVNFETVQLLMVNGKTYSNEKDLDSLLTTFNRFDVLKSDADIKAAKNRINIQSSNALPNISLFYGYNTRYNSGFIDDFNNQLDDNLLSEYGLRINIPIFNNYKNASNVKQAKTEYQNAILAKEKLERQVRHEITLAHQNYLEAIKAIEFATSQLQYAEEAYNLETQRFNLNISDIARYSQATEDILKARSEMVQAKYTLFFQDIFLKYAIGSLEINN